MISVPTWVVLAQWAMLGTCLVFVVVLFRQLAHLLNVSKTVEPRQAGPEVGSLAQDFAYTSLEGVSRRFVIGGEPSLVMFADPGCASCEQALIWLEQIQRRAARGIRTLVATASPHEMVRAIDTFRTSSVEIGIVSRDVPAVAYRTQVTPFAVVIAGDGRVRAKGVPADEKTLRQMIRLVDENGERTVTINGRRELHEPAAH